MLESPSDPPGNKRLESHSDPPGNKRLEFDSQDTVQRKKIHVPAVKERQVHTAGLIMLTHVRVRTHNADSCQDS
ncbi:ATP-dependent Clp protease ATP-binding subunit ClpA like [Dissostichus eleginoides]|uniref:ATP-dependent Clp protease ATP-binding subunit ClpA like n=1 Tax=Dissostichus eleginoides TaxID=100907 RepID=A0AAD9CG72_DISEL|nr:ATP-dependent Clp protease ATP-binding subunit ClpA like [Dissostichus eleginoides]